MSEQPATAEIVATIPVANTLGEGALWNDETQTVWWVDIQESKLHALTWPGRELTVYNTPERLCSFGFLEGTNDWIVAAFESGFALFNPSSGEVDWIAKPAELKSGRRLNDGRVGPDGRFWAGSMIERPEPGHSLEDTGFYSLNAEGVAQLRQGSLQISNGLCWSPDGRTVYFADSPCGKIFSGGYDPKNGFVDVRDFAAIEEGGPDGATTDAQGRVWSAIWGGSKLLAFNPDGSVAFNFGLPVLQPTIPAFGGRDMDLIFVASAREDLSDEQLNTYPTSGHLLVLKAPPGVSGTPPHRYIFAP
jgi:L-arabinonolactonase